MICHGEPKNFVWRPKHESSPVTMACRSPIGVIWSLMKPIHAPDHGIKAARGDSGHQLFYPTFVLSYLCQFIMTRFVR